MVNWSRLFEMIAKCTALRPTRYLAGLALCSVLAACGGGSGGTGMQAGGGTGGTGIVATGAVAEVNTVTDATGQETTTVTVNNKKFKATAATVVSIDENTTVKASDLKTGMQVKIDGVEQNSEIEAKSIAFKNNIEGVVDEVQPANNLVIVKMQRVAVDEKTVFVGERSTGVPVRSLADFEIADLVEVTGLVVDGVTNTILATRIALLPPSENCELVGEISAVAADGKSFTIGNLRVDVTPATTYLPAGYVPTIGDLVFAKGTAFDFESMEARIVQQLTPGLNAKPGSKATMDGFVDGLMGGLFLLSGQLVDSRTAIVEPIGTSLVEGQRVLVEGKILDNGVLAADGITVIGSSPPTNAGGTNQNPQPSADARRIPSATPSEPVPAKPAPRTTEPVPAEPTPSQPRPAKPTPTPIEPPLTEPPPGPQRPPGCGSVYAC